MYLLGSSPSEDSLFSSNMSIEILPSSEFSKFCCTVNINHKMMQSRHTVHVGIKIPHSSPLLHNNLNWCMYNYSPWPIMISHVHSQSQSQIHVNPVRWSTQ